MKSLLLPILCMCVVMLQSCLSDAIQDPTYENNQSTRSFLNENTDTIHRLVFENEEELRRAIFAAEEIPVSTQSNITNPNDYNPPQKGFISLMDCKTIDAVTRESVSYYEALGYDSLVPNENFAKLLNIEGEMEVDNNILKITPKGTYIVPKEYEDDFRIYLSPEDKGRHMKTEIGENYYMIDNKFKYIKTFTQNPKDYSLVSEGDYTELPEDYFDNADTPPTLTRATTTGPNFDSFSIFSADRKTIIGKFIQNLIGSTKSHTINYNNKRRIKGSFYFYNYGVYGEIGVKGWTDKKNLLNWSKTKSDELRVGWRNVIIDIPMPNDLKTALKGNLNAYFKNPEYLDMNGSKVYTASVILPEMDQTFWDKIIAQGTKAAIEFIKQRYDAKKAKDLEKVEAIIISTPTKIRFVAADDDIVKYDEKSYCHVFLNEYLDVSGGWSNTDGFFLYNINQSNASNFATYIKTIIKLLTRQHMTLISGEVYVCARLNSEWRGMKIRKEEKK